MHVKANGPTARARARKKRQDDAYARTIREQVEARDGHCKYGFAVFTAGRGTRCDGDSQWAHFREFGRWKTRGQAPEMRHTTGGSLMLCARHHAMVHARTLIITAVTEAGCDGPLTYRETR